MGRRFFLHHHVQAGSEALPASYSEGMAIIPPLTTVNGRIILKWIRECELDLADSG
jgi:hypothetical protein